MSEAYRENFKLIDWSGFKPSQAPPQPVRKRSRLAGPMVISDTMEPVQSMLDGRMYTSKSKLRATYRAAGVTEVGNDVSLKPPPPPRSRHDRKAVRAAVGRAFSKAGLGA
jgi:hypothetical protein